MIRLVIAEREGILFRSAITTIAILLSLCFSFLMGCRTGVSLISPGKTIQQKLLASQSHQYKFTLQPGQYARLSLEHLGGRLEGSLSDQSGRQVASFYCAESCQIDRSVISVSGGEFFLALRSVESDSIEGAYQLKLDDLRVANSSDPIRIAAELAQTVGDNLRREWQSEKSKQALLKFREAKDHWKRIGEHRGETRALREIGNVHLSLGQIEEAIATYQEALEKSRDSNDVIGQVEASNSLGEVYLLQNDFGLARKFIEPALSLSKLTDNQRLQFQVKANLGEIEGYSNSEKALSLCQEAMQFWIARGERESQAKALLKIGTIYYYAGEYAKAISYFQQSLQLARVLKTRGVEATALAFLGHIHSMIGEKQQAWKYYQTAQQIVVVTGDRIREANLLSGIGFFYDELGDKKRALEYRSRSLYLFRDLNAKRRAALAQIYVGELHTTLGNYSAARQCFEDSLQEFGDLKGERLLPWILRDQGLLYEAQGEFKNALTYYEKALSLNQAGVNERWQAYVWTDIGRIHQHFGNLAQAAKDYGQALALNHKVEDQIGESQTRYYLTKLACAMRDFPTAQAQVEKAISIIESLRSKVLSQEVRTSYFASVNQIYELYIDVMMQRGQERPQANFAADALTTSERARARSLLDLLNDSHHDIKRGTDPKFLEQERTLLQTLNGKAERKLQLTDKREKEQELAALNQELESLNAQIEDVRAKIRENSPRYAALTQPQPLHADEIQQLLDDNTMLLEYALGEDRSYLWAVTKDSLTAFTLPKRAIIENLSSEVYSLLIAPQLQQVETHEARLLRLKQANAQYWPKAAALSQMILAPVADQLGNKRLIVVADGALQRIPFAGLPIPKSGVGTGNAEMKPQEGIGYSSTPNVTPLIVNHEIISLPSASILSVLRKERATSPATASQTGSFLDSIWGYFKKRPVPVPLRLDSVAILADPVFEKDDPRLHPEMERNGQGGTAQSQTRNVDLSNENQPLNRLHETAAEAREIEKAAGAKAFLLKTGLEVNRALLETDELNQYGILHFATHGYWDNDQPELSGLVLSRFDPQGKKQDGFLRLSDIYNLRLPKELVVLSACETGIGRDVRGEGLMALTRGFMYAGAARVIATLWKVDEGATVELMKTFYQKLLREKLTPAAALREAQIAMWRNTPTHAPYEWAAFTLQGEYR